MSTALDDHVSLNGLSQRESLDSLYHELSLRQKELNSAIEKGITKTRIRHFSIFETEKNLDFDIQLNVYHVFEARINEQLQQIHNYNLFLQKLQKLKHEALEEAEKFTDSIQDAALQVLQEEFDLTRRAHERNWRTSSVQSSDFDGFFIKQL
eukprot:gene1343-4520_t